MAWCPDRLIFWEIKTSYWAQLQWWLKFSGRALVRLRIPAFSSFRFFIKLDWKILYSPKHLTHRDCPRVVLSTVTFLRGCDVCMAQKNMHPFIAWGKVGLVCVEAATGNGLWVEAWGQEESMARRSQGGVCRNMPTVTHRDLGQPLWDCPGWSLWQPYWHPAFVGRQNAWASASHMCFQQLVPGLLRDTIPIPGKPFCEGSANISGLSSRSFLSLTQKCFQGSSIASLHVSLRPFRIPSCCVPLGQSSPCAPLSNHASVPKISISVKYPKPTVGSANVLWPVLQICKQLPRLPADPKVLG